MAQRGTTVRLNGNFYDEEGGNLVDPDTLELNIYHGSDLIVGPVTVFDHPTVGIYNYDWDIPVDAPLGEYQAVWEAFLPGDSAPVANADSFMVEAFTSSPGFAGCLWPVDPACLSDEWNALTEEMKARALALASSSLRRLTAYRVGVCPITVRPVTGRSRCFIPGDGYWNGSHPPFMPSVGMSGNWVNCGRGSGPCEVPLPAPIGRVDEVKIDGVVIDPANYTVQSGRFLVWVGADSCPFPTDQNLNLPDSEVGTFSVTYLNAYPVDSSGAYAAGVLAMEFAKACTTGKCALPKGVTSIVRRGVSMEITPGMFADGFTGIREVDAYIGLWNPAGKRQGSTVWSPDMPVYRVTPGV